MQRESVLHSYSASIVRDCCFLIQCVKLPHSPTVIANITLLASLFFAMVDHVLTLSQDKLFLKLILSDILSE